MSTAGKIKFVLTDGPTSSTDNALVRWDGDDGDDIQNSGVILNDSNEMSGVNQLDVDNIRVDGNTISSTNVDGDINLSPNGAGNVFISSVTGLMSSSPSGITGRELQPPSAGFTISNADGQAGDPTFALSDDLEALENLSLTGLAVRSGTNTWIARSLNQPASGITITNSDGVAGNPTFSLSDDLAALESMSGTGLVTRTASNTYAQRTIQPPAAGITIADGDGVSGDPTLSLADDLSALEGMSGTGIVTRTAADTYAQRTITGGAGISIANGDGVSGNPTISSTAGLISRVQFNGNPVAINEQVNVSSVSDDGTGLYTINWNTDYANGNYAINMNASDNSSVFYNTDPVAGSVQIICRDNVLSTPEDPDKVSVTAMGTSS